LKNITDPADAMIFTVLAAHHLVVVAVDAVFPAMGWANRKIT
jgi:hypothetical protein